MQCHQLDDRNVKRKNLDKNELCTVENDIPINTMEYSSKMMLSSQKWKKYNCTSSEKFG